MTLKDLQSFLNSQEQEQSASVGNMQQLLQKTEDKPFWIWGSDKHRQAMKGTTIPTRYEDKRPPLHCCFNHFIGLPKKDGIEHPLYNYEGNVSNALFKPQEFNRRPLTPAEVDEYMKQEIENTTNILKSKKENLNRIEEIMKKQKIEEMIYPFKVQHVFIKKATGLGITELILS